jgi:thioredoxin-related protein
MQIKHNSHIIIVLFTIITFSLAEEWFMPDSNLISDSDFDRKIKEDKSTFKIVKFFSPHCVYCRYLKIAVDKLKHERQWSFAMYDFNCGWYPQFCMQNVRAASFPYTAIYNTEGDLDQ